MFESRAGRRLIVQLARGDNVVDEIAAVVRQHQLRAGEVRATGTLEQLQISTPEGPLQDHKGALDIVSFAGQLAERDGKVELVAQVFAAARGVRGIELVGGRLIRARAAQVELVLETFDDVRPTRASSSLAGLDMGRAGNTPAAPATASAQAPVQSVPDPMAAFERRRPLTTATNASPTESRDRAASRGGRRPPSTIGPRWWPASVPPAGPGDRWLVRRRPAGQAR